MAAYYELAFIEASRHFIKFLPLICRQELVRRGAFDLDEDQVCHNSLLKRLMTELCADEALQQSTRSIACTDDAQSVRDALKQERDMRKNEAIERSLQRQADPRYFERILEQNKKPELLAISPVEDNGDIRDTEFNTDDDATFGEQIALDADPFRSSYSKRGKNKIFVR